MYSEKVRETLEKQAEMCKTKIKETGFKLHEVQILPENLIYLSVYHDACALAGIEQYNFAVDICNALEKHLDKVEG